MFVSFSLHCGGLHNEKGNFHLSHTAQMEALQEKICERTEYALVTDIQITLECLYEAYQMEGDLLKSGKNIYATMIYPFIRMVKEQCSTMGMGEEELHKELWKTYETEEDNVKFVDAAWRFLESHQREAV